MPFLLFAITLVPGPNDQERTLNLPQASLLTTAESLEKAGIINNKFFFFIPAKIANYLMTLKAGEYAFPAHISIAKIIKKMQLNQVLMHKLSIAEGTDTPQILDLVKACEGMSGDIPQNNYLEGMFLPETYLYTYGTTRQSMVQRMQNDMDKFLENAWQNRSLNTVVKNKAETLVLASIIEKEARNSHDRKLIASVFSNRLKLGMKLQADPTTIYALTHNKHKLNRLLTRNDLKIESPWNTYYTAGLPPTPITNPGKESIIAALNPENTKHLYFVVRDCQGNHAFAATLREHNHNIAIYRKLRCTN